jgi:hypothetical protein
MQAVFLCVLLTQQIQVSDADKALYYAGFNYPGAKVCQSQVHNTLVQAAINHSKYMASCGVQGHQFFSQRVAQLTQSMGGYRYAEICAESWQEQANASGQALGYEMFKCWRQSPGHWSVASTVHRFMGAGMTRGKNGIWYACILVAD